LLNREGDLEIRGLICRQKAWGWQGDIAEEETNKTSQEGQASQHMNTPPRIGHDFDRNDKQAVESEGEQKGK
jgi:hypothetical protein